MQRCHLEDAPGGSDRSDCCRSSAAFIPWKQGEPASGRRGILAHGFSTLAESTFSESGVLRLFSGLVNKLESCLLDSLYSSGDFHWIDPLRLWRQDGIGLTFVRRTAGWK